VPPSGGPKLLKAAFKAPYGDLIRRFYLLSEDMNFRKDATVDAKVIQCLGLHLKIDENFDNNLLLNRAYPKLDCFGFAVHKI